MKDFVERGNLYHYNIMRDSATGLLDGLSFGGVGSRGSYSSGSRDENEYIQYQYFLYDTPTNLAYFWNIVVSGTKSQSTSDFGILKTSSDGIVVVYPFLTLPSQSQIYGGSNPQKLAEIILLPEIVINNKAYSNVYQFTYSIPGENHYEALYWN